MKMEKPGPGNADVQNLQNAAGDCVPSPNTRRRLLKLKSPKLHIKLPFLRRGPHHLDGERECHSADVVSHSLPNESFMSKVLDVELYHDCDECNDTSENNSEDLTDSSNISKPGEKEDEADSDKHQSDLEENEKDNEEESKENVGEDDSKENVEQGDSKEKKEDEKTSTEDEGEKTSTEEEGEKTSSDEVTTPSSQECCLKPCLKVGYHGRRRASTYPGPHDCLEANFKRCVRFSPDTVEPATRNCKYKEWIERKCLHPKTCKSPPINIKHEKRKCQLNQMRKVNISDYMSKNYGSSFFSPIGSFGGDMLL